MIMFPLDTSAEAGQAGEAEAKVRPVSVANQQQCCGGLKSGVCSLL